MDTEALAAMYSEIRLTGAYRDAFGEQLEASDVLADLAESGDA